MTENALDAWLLAMPVGPAREGRERARRLRRRLVTKEAKREQTALMELLDWALSAREALSATGSGEG